MNLIRRMRWETGLVSLTGQWESNPVQSILRLFLLTTSTCLACWVPSYGLCSQSGMKPCFTRTSQELGNILLTLTVRSTVFNPTAKRKGRLISGSHLWCLFYILVLSFLKHVLVSSWHSVCFKIRYTHFAIIQMKKITNWLWSKNSNILMISQAHSNFLKWMHNLKRWG